MSCCREPVTGIKYVYYTARIQEHKSGMLKFQQIILEYLETKEDMDCFKTKYGVYTFYREVFEKWIYPFEEKEKAFSSIMSKWRPEYYNRKIKQKYPEEFL